MLDRFYFVLEQCVTTNHRSENIMGLPDSVIGVRRSGQANKSSVGHTPQPAMGCGKLEFARTQKTIQDCLACG